MKVETINRILVDLYLLSACSVLPLGYALG